MEDRPSFNVIWQPWIPVETLQGDICLMGIYETLTKAHELRGVCAESPVYSYSAQRILVAFLIDAYRPDDIDDLKKIIQTGRFDPKTIESYIDFCSKDGECFDLFDEKRPFLQTSMEQSGNVQEAVKLFPEWPEGNNHIHFNHVLENEHSFSPAECALGLCALSAYALNEGRTAYFSINGAPPLYFLYAGKNLFESLAYSMVSKEEYEVFSLSIDDPPVAWRTKDTVPEATPIVKVSLLHGMTSQPRRVQLIPDEVNGRIVIRKIRYERGWDYKDTPHWIDPHIAYKKDTGKALQPKEGRAVWRDLGSILPRGCRPVILKQLDYLKDLSGLHSQVPLHAYALIGEYKGPVYAVMSWFEEPLPIHQFLLDDEDKMEFFLECLQIMESVNSAITRILAHTLPQLRATDSDRKSKGWFKQLSEQAQTLYFTECRDYVMGELADLLNSADSSIIDWQIPYKKNIGRCFKRFALKVFDTMCAGLGTSSRTLEWRAMAENKLRININTSLKGGWLDE